MLAQLPVLFINQLNRYVEIIIIINDRFRRQSERSLHWTRLNSVYRPWSYRHQAIPLLQYLITLFYEILRMKTDVLI